MKTPVLDNITTPQEKEEIFKFMGTDQLVEIKNAFYHDDDPLDSLVRSALSDRTKSQGSKVQHNFTDSVDNHFSVMKIGMAFWENGNYTYLSTWSSEYGIYVWIPIETVEWLTSTDVAMEYLLKDF